MHPQLSDRKRLVCKDFIQALEECHSSSWSAKFIGLCNTQKNELSVCLHGESMKRGGSNRDSARNRKEKRAEAMKEFYADS